MWAEEESHMDNHWQLNYMDFPELFQNKHRRYQGYGPFFQAVLKIYFRVLSPVSPPASVTLLRIISEAQQGTSYCFCFIILTALNHLTNVF